MQLRVWNLNGDIFQRLSGRKSSDFTAKELFEKVKRIEGLSITKLQIRELQFYVTSDMIKN